MPSALFEIYQKNFEKSLKKLSERLELYQKQSKEAQSITLTEAELNISEMERAISQMDMEVIIEKIPDNKKKLNKIIEANKNIVKQYKREIQDLKYKEQSILNKKNFAKIYSNKNNQKTELNLLKEKNNNFFRMMKIFLYLLIKIAQMILIYLIMIVRIILVKIMKIKKIIL